MPVTIEQNTAIKKALRNDLRYITPSVPTRWFYKRGPWRPRSVVSVTYVPGPPAPEVPEVPEVPVPEVIEKAIINIATAATHIIIPGSTGRRIKIHFLTFTVGGDVNITLYDGDYPFTGAMDFGGTSEPRGVVMPQDGVPIPLDVGNDFRILLSAAIQVSGFVLYSDVTG